MIRAGLFTLFIPGPMFLRGLIAPWMLLAAVLVLASAASSSSSQAKEPGVSRLTSPLALLPDIGRSGLPQQPAIAVAVGLKNIIFPPCPPDVVSSVKDQLGIAKFWNLWNITDQQDKALFPTARNQSKSSFLPLLKRFDFRKIKLK